MSQTLEETPWSCNPGKQPQFRRSNYQHLTHSNWLLPTLIFKLPCTAWFAAIVEIDLRSLCFASPEFQ